MFTGLNPEAGEVGSPIGNGSGLIAGGAAKQAGNNNGVAHKEEEAEVDGKGSGIVAEDEEKTDSEIESSSSERESITDDEEYENDEDDNGNIPAASCWQNIKSGVYSVRDYFDEVLPFKNQRAYLSEKVIKNPPLLLWLQKPRTIKIYSYLDPIFVGFQSISLPRLVVITFAGLNVYQDESLAFYLWYNAIVPPAVALLLTIELALKLNNKQNVTLSFLSKFIRSLSQATSFMAFVDNNVGMDASLAWAIKNKDQFHKVVVSSDWPSRGIVMGTVALGSLVFSSNIGLSHRLAESEYCACCSRACCNCCETFTCGTVTRGTFNLLDKSALWLRSLVKTDTFIFTLFTTLMSVLVAIFGSGSIFNLGPIEKFIAVMTTLLGIALPASLILLYQEVWKDRGVAINMLRTGLAAVTLLLLTCETLQNLLLDNGLLGYAQVVALVLPLIPSVALAVGMCFFSSNQEELDETDALVPHEGDRSLRSYSGFNGMSSHDGINEDSEDEETVVWINDRNALNADAQEVPESEARGRVIEETIFCFSGDKWLSLFSICCNRNKNYISQQDRFSVEDGTENNRAIVVSGASPKGGTS